MSDELTPEDEKDRKLLATARHLLRSCREVGMTPADAGVLFGSALGLIFAQSDNQLNDEAFAGLRDVIQITFEIERDALAKPAPEKPHP